MTPFPWDQLLRPALFLFFWTLLLSLRATKSLPLAAALAGVKALFFAVYFGVYFDGLFTSLDDWTYLEGGRDFVAGDIGLTNLAQNMDFALLAGRGEHFLYYLYNAYGIRFFGDHYFAPVALNAALAILMAYLGSSLAAEEFSFSPTTRTLFFLFLALHPDILAWSSLLNVKDTLVLALHVVFLYSIALYYRGKMLAATLSGAFSVALLFALRFYVPLLFSAAFILNAALSPHTRPLRRVLYFLVGAGAGIGIAAWLGEELLIFAWERLSEDLVNPAYGFIRMMLTPIPFGTDEKYSFLNLPALFHWLTMPALLLGVTVAFRKKTSFSRFLLIYFSLFVFLYSVYAELQGPRHRVQLDYAIALFQFLGLASLLKNIKILDSVKTEPEEAIP